MKPKNERILRNTLSEIFHIPIQLKYCSNPRFPLHRKFICQDNYNKKIAPFSFDKINNVNIPVNINVSMSVIDIIKIAEVSDVDADGHGGGGGDGGSQ